MDLTRAAIVSIGVSLFLSALLSFVILAPIRSVLRRACLSGEGVTFWSRFTVVMLFLGPLIVTLVFGVPTSSLAAKLDASEILVRILTSALVGQFLTLAGIGLRLGTLRIENAAPPPIVRKTDDEWVK